MLKETREKFSGLLARQAELNNVSLSAVENGAKFTVEPAVAQKLEERVREESNFLQRINIVPVDQMKGEKVGIGVGSTIAGRTDTDNADRPTQSLVALDKRGYEVVQTNYDTHLTYHLLDTWRHRPDFQPHYTKAVNKQIARDRLMIGWNGTSVADTTDRRANPLLQDVNVGWIQDLKDNRSDAIMTGMKVGKGGDYNNLDALVFDVTEELIAEWHRDNPDMVVICGRKLLSDKYLAMINEYEAPRDKNALDIIISNKQIGGLPAVRVPFFPANGLMVTTLDNLSIYVQNGTTRRAIIDNAKRDRIEDFRSVNEDYVIEDYEAACYVEGILLPDGNGGWA
ncbi:MAG: phage major capsid protein, P2 family [Gammaproteobacteria bacterium]|nr:phage major capsid protein, P2 family [Gammaproteobacteria bacterium]